MQRYVAHLVRVNRDTMKASDNVDQQKCHHESKGMALTDKDLKVAQMHICSAEVC